MRKSLVLEILFLHFSVKCRGFCLKPLKFALRSDTLGLDNNALVTYHVNYKCTRVMQFSPINDAYDDEEFLDYAMMGQKYEMVPLPDSMVPTTLFVSNLCEFVTDDILCDFFSRTSSVDLPCSVARKPNYESKQYGFVVYPSVEEKEAAIVHFDGYLLNNKRIRVEPIKVNDPSKPKEGRVRVSETFVSYVVGPVKKFGRGRGDSRYTGANEMRRVTKIDVSTSGRKKRSKNKGKIRKSTNGLVSRLSEKEKESFFRAKRNGYVTLDGTGYRRGRKKNALASAHRKLCDEKVKPHVVLCKASGGRPLDNVIVDMSPLRLGSFVDSTCDSNDAFENFKLEILNAASRAGMALNLSYEEDNTESLAHNKVSSQIGTKSWATKPISSLPSISLGVFEGDRSKAKQMVKELVTLWEIADDSEDDIDWAENEERNFDQKSDKFNAEFATTIVPLGKKKAERRKGGKTKLKTLSSHRRQRRNERNDVVF